MIYLGSGKTFRTVDDRKPHVLDDEEIEWFRKKLDAATPGPWERRTGNESRQVHSVYPGRQYLLFTGTCIEDLEFAAACKQFVPNLLLTIERLKGLLRETE